MSDVLEEQIAEGRLRRRRGRQPQRHASVWLQDDGTFAVRCNDCKWANPNQITVEDTAFLKRDLHEIVRHSTCP
jgi:hypothetical protein